MGEVTEPPMEEESLLVVEEESLMAAEVIVPQVEVEIAQGEVVNGVEEVVNESGRRFLSTIYLGGHNTAQRFYHTWERKCCTLNTKAGTLGMGPCSRTFL